MSIKKNYFNFTIILLSLFVLALGVYILVTGNDPERLAPIHTVGFGAGFIILGTLILLVNIKLERLSRTSSDILAGRVKQRTPLSGLKKEKEITAKIIGKETESTSKVLNISHKKLFIETKHKLNPEEYLEISISLPLFARPINIRGKVIKITPKRENEGASFDVEVDISDINEEDKRKLTETIRREE